MEKIEQKNLINAEQIEKEKSIQNEVVLKEEEEIVTIEAPSPKIKSQVDAFIDYIIDRSEKYKRLQEIAVKSTKDYDWILFGGKPYLTSAGAERIRALLGISITELKYERKKLDDGHYLYLYTAVFSIGDLKFEAIGSASSHSKFFSTVHGKEIPASEIDETKIQKAAYSNLITNGVSRLLGIRSLSKEDLTKFGINPKVFVAFKQ